MLEKNTELILMIVYHFLHVSNRKSNKQLTITEMYTEDAQLFKYFNSYSAGIDFSRQNLTSTVDTRAVRVKIFIMGVDP